MAKSDRKNISVYLTSEDIKWMDTRGEARGAYLSRLIARDRTGEGPSEEMRRLTLLLRKHLDVIDDAIADAQDVASEIETSAGLVTESGARVDEASGKLSLAKPPKSKKQRVR